MDLSDLLTPAAVLPSLHAQSKKQVLQEVSATAAKLTGLAEREIFDTLLAARAARVDRRRAGRCHPARQNRRPLDRLVGVFARLAAPGRFRLG